jgi:CBS domain-containing protein
VFAPSLFMGAMLGSAFGQAAHGLLPSLTSPVARVLETAAAMGPPPTALDPAATLDEALDHFAVHGGTVAPVAGPEGGALAGIVALSAVERALAGDAEARVGDIARVPPTVRAHEPLHLAVDAIADAGEDGLPILAADGDAVVGWVTQRDALAAYRASAAARAAAGATVGGLPSAPPSTSPV